MDKNDYNMKYESIDIQIMPYKLYKRNLEKCNAI